MSEEAVLSVGKCDINVSTNYLVENFLDLFSMNSKKKCPYYYAYGIIEYKDAYSAKLSIVKRRLDIQGYTLKQAICILKRCVRQYNIHNCVNIDSSQLYRYLLSINVLHSEINNIQFSEVVSEIDSKSILRILSENTMNLNADVMWKCEDLIEAGYITENEIENSKHTHRILIATEGKTDAYILENSIKILFPNISDLFYFFKYTATDNLNVSGCKELAKFCKLISQLSHSKVIALFDNDGDGSDSYNIANKKNEKDKNLLIIKLPVLNSMCKVTEKKILGLIRQSM